MEIRIQPSDEKFQVTLEALEKLGVDVITMDEDPLVTGLIYIAKVTAKLDLLGNMSPINKSLKSVASAMEELRQHYANLNAKAKAHFLRKRIYHRELCKLTQHDLEMPNDIEHLSYLAILLLFKPFIGQDDLPQWKEFAAALDNS